MPPRPPFLSLSLRTAHEAQLIGRQDAEGGHGVGVNVRVCVCVCAVQRRLSAAAPVLFLEMKTVNNAVLLFGFCSSLASLLFFFRVPHARANAGRTLLQS